MPWPAVMMLSVAGRDHRLGAEAVAVLDLALDQPADGLQPGVRVRPDLHPGASLTSSGP